MTQLAEWSDGDCIHCPGDIVNVDDRADSDDDDGGEGVSVRWIIKDRGTLAVGIPDKDLAERFVAWKRKWLLLWKDHDGSWRLADIAEDGRALRWDVENVTQGTPHLLLTSVSDLSDTHVCHIEADPDGAYELFCVVRSQ
jgi:hypothetical protein